MGNPIAHSRSPAIHAAFARQTGEALRYQAVLVPLEGFADAVEAFRRAGGLGINVTIPFKEQAWTLARRRVPRAELAGAVNTLWFDDRGECHGDNTDGVGLVRDLLINQRARMAGRRLLLLGAGGAARGVLEPLLAEAPRELVIANRTVKRGEALAAIFAARGQVRACGFDVLRGQSFDLIINATSASLAGELPPLPDGLLVAGGWCYDMMYAAEPTPFLRWALAQGAGRAVDGLGMLVEQAAESFFIWRGVRPDTSPVIQSLRRALQGTGA